MRGGQQQLVDTGREWPLSTLMHEVMERVIEDVIDGGRDEGLRAMIRRMRSAVSKSGNAADAMKLIFHYWVVAVVGAVYQCGGAYISPNQLKALAVVLAYVLLPDPSPGPIDDALLLFLVAAYVGSVTDFAKWIRQQERPPQIPGLTAVASDQRRKIEDFLWKTAKRHAGEILSDDRNLEQTARELVLGSPANTATTA